MVKVTFCSLYVLPAARRRGIKTDLAAQSFWNRLKSSSSGFAFPSVSGAPWNLEVFPFSPAKKVLNGKRCIFSASSQPPKKHKERRGRRALHFNAYANEFRAYFPSSRLLPPSRLSYSHTFLPPCLRGRQWVSRIKKKRKRRKGRICHAPSVNRGCCYCLHFHAPCLCSLIPRHKRGRRVKAPFESEISAGGQMKTEKKGKDNKHS